MIPVLTQIKAFLNTVGMGFLIGIIFDAYQAGRRALQIKKMLLNIIDIFFSLMVTGIVFCLLLYSNWGEVRFYVFLGIILGLFLYYKFFHKTMYNFWHTWFKTVGLTFRFIIRVVSIPLIFLYRIGRFCKMLLLRTCKSFLKPLKILKKFSRNIAKKCWYKLKLVGKKNKK